jgi:hypothetical protein
LCLKSTSGWWDASPTFCSHRRQRHRPSDRTQPARAGTWSIDKNTIKHDLSSEWKCHTLKRTGPDTVELQSADFIWMPACKAVSGNLEKLWDGRRMGVLG